MGALGGRFRCVATSLLGYGSTAERRTAHDPSIEHETDVVEAVVRRAGDRVHLVGHSFGGLVSLAAAIGDRVALASLTVAEAPAVALLQACGEHQHYQAFRQMTAAYFADFESGNAHAIATMIDFYGGAARTFAAWPSRARDYAAETTPVNILDWASAYGFPLSPTMLGAIDMPVLVARGGASPPAVQRANGLIAECIDGAALVTIAGAAHFMIATHAREVAALVARHVLAAEARLAPLADRATASA